MIRWLNPVYGLSIAWLVLSTIAFGPDGWQAVLLVAALKTAPLAVFLPALLQRQANPLMVLSLVLLFYMGYAAMLCFKPGAEGYSIRLSSLDSQPALMSSWVRRMKKLTRSTLGSSLRKRRRNFWS